jgi:hypothetical protein
VNAGWARGFGPPTLNFPKVWCLSRYPWNRYPHSFLGISIEVTIHLVCSNGQFCKKNLAGWDGNSNCNN